MNLTPKQKELIRLYAEGYTPKEIEEISGLAHSTINTHWVRIKERLATRTRVSAVVIAVKRGLIEVDDY